mmetsp:Transcript_34923/g.82333  ORF Transcript_34923/g.82333 Transcript_34923/m.82333 type:complete len:208 (-) Transcript_34923:80-703(-)
MLSACAARAWVPDSAGEFSRRSMVVTFSPAFCARGSTSPRPPRSGGPHRRSLAMWVPIVQQRCVASTIAVSIVFRNSSERSDAPMEFSSVGAASWVDSLAVHSVWYALLSDARCTLPMACASLSRSLRSWACQLPLVGRRCPRYSNVSWRASLLCDARPVPSAKYARPECTTAHAARRPLYPSLTEYSGRCSPTSGAARRITTSTIT